MGNRIINRIKRENVPLEANEIPVDYFSATYDGKILYPEDTDLNNNSSVFSLAHELGHIYQYKKRGKVKEKFDEFARDEFSIYAKYSIFTNLSIIWDEFDAWIWSYRICKQEKVSTKGFLKHAISCFSTYIKQSLKRFSIFHSLFFIPLLLVTYVTHLHISFEEFLKGSGIICFSLLSIFEFGMTAFFFIEYYLEKKDEEFLNKKV